MTIIPAVLRVSCDESASPLPARPGPATIIADHSLRISVISTCPDAAIHTNYTT